MSRRSDFLIAIGLANALLLREWRNYLWPRGINLFQAPNFLVAMVALVFCIAIVTVAIYLALRTVSRIHSERMVAALHLGLLLLMIFPFNTIRATNNFPARYPVVSSSFWFEKIGVIGCLAVIATALILLATPFFFFPRKSVRFSRVILVSLFGFVVVSAANLVAVLAAQVTHLTPAMPQVPPNEKSARMVIHIFDELSTRFLETYSGGVPEFTRFQSEAFSADNATSPASVTRLSLPSYLNGNKPALEADAALDMNSTTYFNRLRVAREHEAMHLFKRAKALGYRTAAIGWYIPYCSLYGAYLDYCRSYADLAYDYVPSLFSNMKMMLGRITLLQDNPDIRNFKGILQAATELVKDERYDLVWIHWPIPHLPGIYHPDTDSIEFRDNSEDSYVANMQLASHTFGELRTTMEKAGLWESSTVAVLSDHSTHRYRCWSSLEPYDDRIPFMVKLAHQSQGKRYKPRLNVRLLHPLVSDWLSGKNPRSTSLVAWFDSHPLTDPPVSPVYHSCP